MIVSKQKLADHDPNKMTKFNIIDLMKEWLLEQGFHITMETRNSLSAIRSNVRISLAYHNCLGYSIWSGTARTGDTYHKNSGVLDPADPELLDKLAMVIENGR